MRCSLHISHREADRSGAMDTAGSLGPAKGVVGCHSRGLGRVDPSDPIGKTNEAVPAVPPSVRSTLSVHKQQGANVAAKLRYIRRVFRLIDFVSRAFRQRCVMITVPSLRNCHMWTDPTLYAA